MASAHLGAAIRHIHVLFGEGTLADQSDAQLLERYVKGREELAFQALVQRHGPMVLGVCRGILHDPNDADDAFQAAFLLLARKASSLWVVDSLGGWLHRVAGRIACQIRSDASRRSDRERRAAEMAAARSSSVMPGPGDDSYLVLHEEIDRLPERFRKPFVLCYLEHMTYQQTASHLRWSEGMTQGRLARARSLLRARLSRRGVTLTVSALGTLARPPGASAVSVAMVLSTVRTARYFGLGETAAGIVSTTADALVKQALRSMFMAKLKMVAHAGLVVGALTFVAAGLSATGPIVAEEPAASAPRAAADVPATPRGRPASSGDPSGATTAAPAAPESPAPGIADDGAGNPVNRDRDLKPGERLNKGDSLFSSLAGFRLRMRMDGNLVLYPIDDQEMPRDVTRILDHNPQALTLYNTPIWSTGTNVPGDGVEAGSYCEMGEDGDFVIYDGGLKPCFSTGTTGHPGAFLQLQNDGNLVIYTPDLKVLWASDTAARAPE